MQHNDIDKLREEEGKLFKKTLEGSSIGPSYNLIPKPANEEDIDKMLDSLLSKNTEHHDFYKMCKHYSGLMRSKTHAKDQLSKILEIYILSLYKQYPNEEQKETIKKIEKHISQIIKEFDNLSNGVIITSEYFKTGLAGFLTKLL